MAASRQLSTEQAVLQGSLEECKGSKRLSLENEELLWKLQNGTLCSPKRSPTSPAIPFQASTCPYKVGDASRKNPLASSEGSSLIKAPHPHAPAVPKTIPPP
ncbi:hypothetical protein AB1E18_018157 [Capra hircus]